MSNFDQMFRDFILHEIIKVHGERWRDLPQFNPDKNPDWFKEVCKAIAEGSVVEESTDGGHEHGNGI